jgi:maltose-binding protein MalE
VPAAARETIGLIWRLHMKKALTAACAVTILVALSAQDASAATAAEQPVQASGEATEEVQEANEAVGELTDDTVITTKVSAVARPRHGCPNDRRGDLDRRGAADRICR